VTVLRSTAQYLSIKLTHVPETVAGPEESK
jgi:hypothetical protein